MLKGDDIMGHYLESKVPPKLEIGKSYTERQLLLFIIENEDSIILSDSAEVFDEWSTKEHVLKEVKEEYIHYSEAETYIINEEKYKIYFMN